jgi:UDP-N-acetylmuramoyl-tripeptide--D-alanyl-D-alanine ligase
MTGMLLGGLALFWLIGACFRAYRQARFFQIEEYKINRYLRWWLHRRERLLPRRAFIPTVIGGALVVMLSEGGPFVPAIIGLLASAVAVWPPDEGEIKKPFRATPRARRLLGTAFLLIMLVGGLLMVIVANLNIDAEYRIALIMALGLALVLAAPLFLAMANTLMMPVESLLRRRFINQARAVMDAIQPKVIGITGSYGKTTTKTFLAEILNGRYRAYPTPKSYNTMMGVCMAINNDLSDNYAVDYFIVEMGAYIAGEIQRICGLTPPEISIVVEVGPQHLERFGSLENIATAKYEIVKALPPDGLAVFNWDNPYVRAMYERGYPANRLAVSRTADPAAVGADGPRFIATNIHEDLNGLRFTVHDQEHGQQAEFVTAVLGEHNVTNILLAAAVAVHEGMSLQDIAFRVRQLQPAESRLVRQTTAQGITIINDAYSANPSGVLSALKVLSMHEGGRRLLITPGMVELANLHEQENKRLGQAAAQHATDVILIGAERTRPIKAGLLEAQFPAERLQVMETLAEAVRWYETNLQSGDTVLFLNDLPDTY